MLGYGLYKVEGPRLADLQHYRGHLSVIDRIFERIVPGGLAGIGGKLRERQK